MPPYRLVIPRPIHEELLDHARAEWPNECCGLLSGTVTAGRGEVRALHRLGNELASPVAYRSEPRSMFAAMKAMRAAGTDVVAVYHSHPVAPPVPSLHDLRQNYSEHVVNLIVGLTTVPPTVRGWRLRESDYEPAEFDVTG